MNGVISKTSDFKGVLFDLDGTLLDTANDLGEALNYVLKQHDTPQVKREHYRPVASDGAKGLLELGFGKSLTTLDYNALRQQFLTYYQENIAVHTALYPGIAELITALDNDNIPWGIVTNKPIGLTNLLLPHYQEFEQCRSLLGGDSLPERKPHPAPLLQASEEIGIPANQCLYIGDAPRDIEAGNAAGMFTVIAQWGYIADKSVCRQWQANFIADHPKDILTLI